MMTGYTFTRPLDACCGESIALFTANLESVQCVLLGRSDKKLLGKAFKYNEKQKWIKTNFKSLFIQRDPSLVQESVDHKTIE